MLLPNDTTISGDVHNQAMALPKRPDQGLAHVTGFKSPVPGGVDPPWDAGLGISAGGPCIKNR